MRRLAHEVTQLKAAMPTQVAATVAAQLATLQGSMAPPHNASALTEPPPATAPPPPDPLKELFQMVGELQMAVKGVVEELRASKAKETPRGTVVPTATAALGTQGAPELPPLPPPPKAQGNALEGSRRVVEPTPEERRTPEWPELSSGHQSLSVSEVHEVQIQVLKDKPGSASAAEALLQLRLRQKVQHLPAATRVALERSITLNARGGVTSSFVIGIIPVVGWKVEEACEVCACAAQHVTRRWCTYRRGGPDAQREWQKGPQAQLERLHHGPVCSKCTGTDLYDKEEWLVYDSQLASYRPPTPTENRWGVKGTSDRYWTTEEKLSAFNQLPSHVESHAPYTPPSWGQDLHRPGLGQTGTRGQHSYKDDDEYAGARGAHSQEKEEYEKNRLQAQRQKIHFESKKGFVTQVKNVVTPIEDAVYADCYTSAKGEALLAADKQLDTVIKNHTPELKAYLQALESIGEPPHYTVCRELVYALSAPESDLRAQWLVDSEGHDRYDEKWETLNTAVHTWLLDTLIRTEQERNHAMSAARTRVSSFADMRTPPAPRQVADQMLRQRKLCRAIQRGEHLTLPLIAYWWGQALPHQVKNELSALLRTNRCLGTGTATHWDTFPSDGMESDFWKLVNLAEEIFNQVSAQPANGRRREIANQVAEDQHAPEDTETSTDTVLALRQVGPTGPKRTPYQQSTGRPWTKYRPRPETPQGAAGPSTLQRQGPSAFAVVGDPHYQGCWGCGGKDHLKRDCPHKVDAENAVVKALQTSVTSEAPMAEQVSREVLCALAAQGCTADLEAHLTQQQCLVVGDFMESGQPECLMKVYTASS